MRRLWWRAPTALILACTVLTPISQPLSRAHPADALAMDEPPGTEASQEPIRRAGPELEQRPQRPGMVREEAQHPGQRPKPAPIPIPGTPLRTTAVYTPSAIPIEDLRPDHPLINLNLRLPAQDPDVVGPRIAATLREHKAKQELAPEAALQASPEIEALADGLDNDPRLIYQYVHNHFNLVPTWGLVKSPRETYLAKAGNPFDQAALLVTLLQAAGYDAEFVFGVIQIPLDDAMNWVGVTNPQVLPYVFWNGGVAAEVQEDVLRLAHVWARVRIDGSWHPLDPSFKAFAHDPGIDLATVLGYNRSAFLAAAESGSTVTADYVRYINGTNINSRLTQYSNNLIDYLRANSPFAYLEDVIGGRDIVPETLDGFPTQLPYTVETVWGETAEMPDDYIYKLHIEVPGIDYWANLPDVAGERTTIFYVGATPADQAAIDAAGGIYNVNPAYQVNMKPELRVGGELMATGAPLSLGSWEPITVTVVSSILDEQGDPWTARYAPQSLQAGAWYALPMMFQTVSPEALRRHHRALTESRATGSPDDSEPVLGQSLYNIGLSYFNQVDASERIDAQIAGVVLIPHVRGMLMSQDLTVLEWQQVGGEWKAKRLGPASYTIDVRLVWSSVLSASGDADRERGFMTDTGHKSSAIEHATIEQLQNNPSLSTIQVLDIANEEGLKIYHIISSTVDAVLPLLDYPAYIKDSLRADVDAGYEVTVPEGNVTYHDWTGTGWISFHPPSGSAGYWLNGSIGGTPAGHGVPAAGRGGSGGEEDTIDPAEVWEELETALEGTEPDENDPDPSAPNNAGADPVDTLTGAFVHSSADVAFGTQGFPISFARTYVSERNWEDGPLGYGWTHSYQMSVVESSEWARGFGYRAALDAVAATVEAYVGVDVATTPAGALPHQRIVIGSEASDWILAQMTDNVVSASGMTGQPHQYLLLPDGSYTPAHGRFSTLMQEGDSTYAVEFKDGSWLDFDAEGRPTSLADANGNQTTLTYDAGGDLIRVTDAVGRSIELSYTDGRLTQVSDPAGRTFNYAYDTTGNLVRYTDAKGGIRTYAYDSEHRVTSITDPEGITFATNIYDDFGRVTSQINGSGATMTFHYGDMRSTVTDPMGYPTVYYYDNYDRPVGLRDSNGYTSSTVYDAYDNVISRTDPKGGVTTFGYDARGNLTRITFPLGQATTFAYDLQDNLTAITDALGRTSHLAYDARHNLTRHTDAQGDATEYDYDSRGQLVAITDANGHTSTISHDGHGNPIQVDDALGHSTSFSYDMLGRNTSVTTPMGHTVQFTYDANDFPVTSTDALGGATTYGRDGNNLLTRVTDARGNSTDFTYNPQQNLAGVTDALGHGTSYAYDANESLRRVTNAKGKATVYERDGLGQATRITDALGRAVSFEYGGNGNLSEVTKADGNTIQYEFDANDRLTHVSYPDGSAITYTYDAVGNVTSTQYGSWSVQYEYDVLDRVVRENLPGANVAIAYAYDAVGNLQRIEAWRGGTLVYDVGYEYDAADRLTRIVDNVTSQAISYTYDADDNLSTVAYPSGATTAYDYDAKGRVTGVDNVDASGSTMSSWEYTYDDVDNPVLVTRTTPGASLNASYAYDALDQLIRENYPRYEVEYVYDEAGNRVRSVSPMGIVDYSYDAADQLLSAGSVTFTYDANGNQVSKTDAQGTYAYHYDYEDRLIRITGPGDTVTTFSYDHAGRRIAVRGPTGERRFIYEGLSLILEEADGAVADLLHIYGNGLLTASRPLDSGLAPVTVAHHGNGRGSVVNLSDADGKPKAAYSFSAFGQGHAPAGGAEQPYRFSGQWGVRSEGAVADLYLMGFRYYDASTGRFLTPDPLPGSLDEPLTLNRYTYALNNPLRYADPLGLQAKLSCPLEDDKLQEALEEARAFDIPKKGMTAEAKGAQQTKIKQVLDDVKHRISETDKATWAAKAALREADKELLDAFHNKTAAADPKVKAAWQDIMDSMAKKKVNLKDQIQQLTKQSIYLDDQKQKLEASLNMLKKAPTKPPPKPWYHIFKFWK